MIDKNLWAKVLLLLIFIGFMFPAGMQARSISELKSIKLVDSDEINQLCLQPEGYDPVSGCYLTTDEIYIRDDLPMERFKFVFLHEMGHFFMRDVGEEQYKLVFNPAPQKLASQDIKEIANDTFALWIMGGKVPKIQEEFFINILVN